MRIRTWWGAAFALVLVLGVGACKRYVTEPITRRPAIASVVAFPTTLGPGDSTMVTVSATDPDGDALVYDWESFNGLVMRGPYGERSVRSNTRSSSMVFYRSATWPYPHDTAFIFCSARDQRGGSDSRQVLIRYEN